MIYLFTDNATKKKTILVKDLAVLPTGDSTKVEFNNNNYSYYVGNQIFANISVFPTHMHGTDEDMHNIATYFFQNCNIKKIDSTDFFLSYLVYLGSNS